MDDLQQLLRNYLDALSEPTRANLVLELQAAGELTATQLAKRLGLSVNNVYHHIRVLNRLGVLAKPRIVPGPTYVEKYYQVLPEISKATDPGWYDAASGPLSTAERQARWAAFCAQVGQIFLRAAERYAAMSPEDWNETVLARQSGMISLRLLPAVQYEADLAKLRGIVMQQVEGVEECQQVMVIAGLPELMRIGPAGELPRGAGDGTPARDGKPPARQRRPSGK